jgi:hypothetical protein
MFKNLIDLKPPNLEVTKRSDVYVPNILISNTISAINVNNYLLLNANNKFHS